MKTLIQGGGQSLTRADQHRIRATFGDRDHRYYTSIMTLAQRNSIAQNEAAPRDAAGFAAATMLRRLVAAVKQLAKAIWAAKVGGPGDARRQASILLLALIVAMIRTIRARTTIVCHTIMKILAIVRRHLCRPPANWAAA